MSKKSKITSIRPKTPLKKANSPPLCETCRIRKEQEDDDFRATIEKAIKGNPDASMEEGIRIALLAAEKRGHLRKMTPLEIQVCDFKEQASALIETLQELLHNSENPTPQNRH